ncbi:MAG TPA: hypothetical protein PKZ42_01700 [Syntrophales bacterium]|nr:hypothetical protein [Syntrophales bacterium]
MSLKSGLFNEIKNAYPNMYSLERVEGYAKLNGYKISNSERRLRELCEGENPLIRAVRGQKGYIIGYIYQQEKKLEIPVLGTIKDKKIDWKQRPLFEMRIRD